jgi:hypothetical protein
LPLPLLLVVIHAALLEALQLQPARAVTVTLALPPAETADALVGEIE